MIDCAGNVVVIVLAVLPIVLGVLIRQFAGSGGLAGLDNKSAQQTLLVLVICACFTVSQPSNASSS